MLALLTAGASFAATSATSQAAYPSKVVRLILPFSPGGPSDLVSRVLAAEFERKLGASFIVESRPGAASNIGTAAVARSDPDGYTLLVPANNFMINPAIYKTPGYDPIADFAPVSELASSPCVIVSNPATGIETLSDLIARDQVAPGKLNYATPGVGSPNHLVFEMLSAQAKLKLTHVPYQGGAPAVQAALAGTTEIASTLLPNILSHVENRSLNALAVTGQTRVPDLPSVPTLVELGYSGLDIEIVFMLVAPARTPGHVLDILVPQVTAIMNTKEVQDRLKVIGFRVIARGPEPLRARIEREVTLFKGLVAELNIPQR